MNIPDDAVFAWWKTTTDDKEKELEAENKRLREEVQWLRSQLESKNIDYDDRRTINITPRPKRIQSNNKFLDFIEQMRKG